jgi:hypothetical protein
MTSAVSATHRLISNTWHEAHFQSNASGAAQSGQEIKNQLVGFNGLAF